MELTLELGRQILLQQPFSRLLGAQLARPQDGHAELSLDLRADFCSKTVLRMVACFVVSPTTRLLMPAGWRSAHRS